MIASDDVWERIIYVSNKKGLCGVGYFFVNGLKREDGREYALFWIVKIKISFKIILMTSEKYLFLFLLGFFRAKRITNRQLI